MTVRIMAYRGAHLRIVSLGTCLGPAGEAGTYPILSDALHIPASPCCSIAVNISNVRLIPCEGSAKRNGPHLTHDGFDTRDDGQEDHEEDPWSVLVQLGRSAPFLFLSFREGSREGAAEK